MNRFLAGVDVSRYGEIHVKALEDFADGLDQCLNDLQDHPHLKGVAVTDGGDSRKNKVVENFRAHYGLAYHPTQNGIALALTRDNKNENWLRLTGRLQ